MELYSSLYFKNSVDRNQFPRIVKRYKFNLISVIIMTMSIVSSEDIFISLE